MTNLREIAPPKLVIPAVFLIQSVAVEYDEEYIVVEPIKSRVKYVVSSLRWWQN